LVSAAIFCDFFELFAAIFDCTGVGTLEQATDFNFLVLVLVLDLVVLVVVLVEDALHQFFPFWSSSIGSVFQEPA